MAGDYVLPEEAETALPRRSEKILKVLIVIAVLGLIAELIWLLGITPFRPFSRIDLITNAAFEREEIFAVAGINGKSSFFTTDARAMESSLMNLSALQSARVFKHFPDRLQIVLEGRRAVACALATVNGKTVPVFFDSHGVVFRIGWDDTDEAFPLLPVISGLVIENPVLGMKLPVMFAPLLKKLEDIGSSASELLAAISEIRVNPRSFDGYDLTLYPVHRRVKVRLSELNEDLLRFSLLMVDVLAANESGIDSLDFRSGIASYIPKEAYSE